MSMQSLSCPAPLLQVEELSVAFETDAGDALAVDGVSFSLKTRETLCLVGESGCGKSATALSILRLLPAPPARTLSGRILFEGRDLVRLPERELRRVRGGRVGMVFQEPMTSLNPVFRVGEQIAEGLRLHSGLSQAEARAKAVALLEEVGIPSAERRVDDFPHQMSGGMRQRVMIAMAVACEPALIIADEPTTALDVTIQSQVLELLRALVQEKNSGLLLITHDLGVMRDAADRVAVMYLGKIVEYAPAAELFHSPLHPYTRGLMRSRPGLDPQGRKKRLPTIPGAVPGLLAKPSGCPFRDRCPETHARCLAEPPFTDSDGHFCRCWLRAS
jgi:oligopeptide/dipeptide ABC transporter ATP-binding protein